MISQAGKPTILIVDDVAENLDFLGETLCDDYVVRFATSGQQALDIVNADTGVDLVLLDIVMPGLDGYEVCRRLKASDRTRRIPVIFITAKDGDADEMEGLKLGAVDYIRKPFFPPIVLARVNTHISLKRRTDLLEELACRDGLTSIPNRRQFEQTLRTEWRRMSRARMWLSIVLMDIDHFKLFNDNYGHPAGDRCLRKVARTLAATIFRPADLIARYGGEEFVALLPETAVSNAKLVAERLRLAVRNLRIAHATSPLVKHVTISLGVASIIPTTDVSTEQLVEAADGRLYQAKQDGRDQIREVVIEG